MAASVSGRCYKATLSHEHRDTTVQRLGPHSLPGPCRFNVPRARIAHVRSSLQNVTHTVFRQNCLQEYSDAKYFFFQRGMVVWNWLVSEIVSKSGDAVCCMHYWTNGTRFWFRHSECSSQWLSREGDFPSAFPGRKGCRETTSF